MDCLEELRGKKISRSDADVVFQSLCQQLQEEAPVTGRLGMSYLSDIKQGKTANPWLSWDHLH